MSRLAHITAAVDFSPSSRAAAMTGYAIARRHGADLTLVHAIEPLSDRHAAAAAMLGDPLRDEIDASRRETARHQLEALVRELGNGLPHPKIWCDVVAGPAAAGVCRGALEAAADLIVLGSRGKSQALSWVLGSTTRDVAAAAQCPVLVVREEPNQAFCGGFSRVTIGVGRDTAGDLVAACDLVGEPGWVGDLIRAGGSVGELEALVCELGLDPARFAGDAEVGSPAAVLLDRARDDGADLIAVGSHARERLSDRLLGTTAERILRRSPVPVLMLPTTSIDRARTAPTGAMAVFEELNRGPCKTYLIAAATGEAMIVDPLHDRVESYRSRLAELGLDLVFAVDTHVHADHLSGAARLAELEGANYVVFASSTSVCATLRVSEGDRLELGQLEARILHTPGHAQDAMTLVFRDRLLTGDFLFIGEGGAGRTDLPGGDPREHWAALKKLESLDGALLVFPGHDYHDHTFSTLAAERLDNPRLKPRRADDYVAWLESYKLGPAEWMADVIRANYACAPETAEIAEHATPTCEVGGTAGELVVDMVRRVSVADLERALAAGRAVVIDVRELAEHQSLPPLPVARRIPLGALAGRIGDLRLPLDQPIVAVCRTGARSDAAAAVLAGAGFADVASLAGGMVAWNRRQLEPA